MGANGLRRPYSIETVNVKIIVKKILIYQRLISKVLQDFGFTFSYHSFPALKESGTYRRVFKRLNSLNQCKNLGKFPP